MDLKSLVTRSNTEPPVSVLALYGEVSSETVGAMDESIDSLLAGGERIVLDLAHTLYVSSAGWRSLVSRCRKGPQSNIRVAGMSQAVKDVFYLLGINYVVQSFETVPEALASYAVETAHASGQMGRKA